MGTRVGECTSVQLELASQKAPNAALVRRGAASHPSAMCRASTITAAPAGLSSSCQVTHYVRTSEHYPSLPMRKLIK